MSNDKRPEWVPSDLNPKRILTDDNGRILRRAFYGGFWDEPKGTNLEVYADASQAGMDRHPEIEKRLDMDKRALYYRCGSGISRTDRISFR